jgi:DNA-binding GntR family transcriptional regulator
MSGYASPGSEIERTPLAQPFAERPKLGEEVTRYLREQVLSQKFPVGERLAIDKIAQELGVSSMPGREALTTLASEGIVDMLPRRGFRVAPVTRQDVEDTFVMHATVAGLLARRACANFSEEDVTTLREIQEKMERVAVRRMVEERRLSAIEELNFAFHRRINTRADGRRLRWFLRASQRFVPGHYYFTTPGWVDLSLRDHMAIIDALAARDPDAAEASMRRHILNGGALIVERMDAADAHAERASAGAASG